jgi:hypothetical protein
MGTGPVLVASLTCGYAPDLRGSTGVPQGFHFCNALTCEVPDRDDPDWGGGTVL